MNWQFVLDLLVRLTLAFGGLLGVVIGGSWGAHQYAEHRGASNAQTADLTVNAVSRAHDHTVGAPASRQAERRIATSTSRPVGRTGTPARRHPPGGDHTSTAYSIPSHRQLLGGTNALQQEIRP